MLTCTQLPKDIVPSLDELKALLPENRVIMPRFRCPFPRLQCTFGEFDYKYSGITLKAQPIPPRIQRLLDHINKDMTTPYNFVLMNGYVTGADYVSAHADDEPTIDQSVPIATISVGAERKFRIRCKNTKLILKDKMLESGSLCIMAAENFQRKYTHEIVKTKKAVGLRISITLRRMKTVAPLAPPPAPKKESKLEGFKRKMECAGLRNEGGDIDYFKRRLCYLDYLESVPRDAFRNPAYLMDEEIRKHI